ncbi:hypothetical protein DENSPDRAFT_855692 [Dentipellis sp. KUC8613]|nr:hypothetical protein DENSPDRAFT_855692 [Dentipellis sp. KUC8613]
MSQSPSLSVDEVLEMHLVEEATGKCHLTSTEDGGHENNIVYRCNDVIWIAPPASEWGTYKSLEDLPGDYFWIGHIKEIREDRSEEKPVYWFYVRRHSMLDVCGLTAVVPKAMLICSDYYTRMSLERARNKTKLNAHLDVESDLDEEHLTLADIRRLPICRIVQPNQSPFSIEKIICAAHRWVEEGYDEPSDVIMRLIQLADANADSNKVLDAVKIWIERLGAGDVVWYECPQCSNAI